MKDALNRVADALFAIAKEERRQAKASERSVELQCIMLEMHEQQAATSKALEEALIMQSAEIDADRAN